MDLIAYHNANSGTDGADSAALRAEALGMATRMFERGFIEPVRHATGCR